MWITYPQIINILTLKFNRDFYPILLLCYVDMLLDFLFPRFCVICRSFGYFICSKCKERIEYVGIQDLTQINTPDYIDKVFCIVKYKSVVKTLIKAIKYKLQYSIIDELSEIVLSSRIKELINNEVLFESDNVYLQPIPLHPNLVVLIKQNYLHPCSPKFIYTLLLIPLHEK